MCGTQQILKIGYFYINVNSFNYLLSSSKNLFRPFAIGAHIDWQEHMIISVYTCILLILLHNFFYTIATSILQLSLQ